MVSNANFAGRGRSIAGVPYKKGEENRKKWETAKTQAKAPLLGFGEAFHEPEDWRAETLHHLRTALHPSRVGAGWHPPQHKSFTFRVAEGRNFYTFPEL